MEAIIFFAWLGLAGAIAWIANARGRSWVAWAIVSVLLSPVLAYLLLVAVPVQGSRPGER
jgi:hypothetical protein